MYAMRLRDVAPDHDLALIDDILGDEQIDVAEEDAEQQPAEKSRHRHAARSRVIRKDVVRALGIIELGRRRIDDGVIVARLAKIKRGLVNLQPHVRDRRNILYIEHRQPLGVLLVDRAHREPRAVGELEMLIDPGLRGVGQRSIFISRGDSITSVYLPSIQ